MVALIATVKTTCCKMTYDEIREQLQDGEITIEEAQVLWLKHRDSEQKKNLKTLKLVSFYFLRFLQSLAVLLMILPLVVSHVLSLVVVKCQMMINRLHLKS